jgi:acyl-coenzyme A synthetase/AMP-(fatty) acid ligase/acyl carrier protein
LALRYVIFGGEALEMQSLRPWYERHGDSRPQLVNMYGITETTVHVTYRPLSQRDLTSGSVIGRPIPDLQVYLLNGGQMVPVGIPGEMFVGGAGVGRGYLERPDLTAERFIPNPFGQTEGERLYRTGDLARYLPDGSIEFLGRVDQQVKIRGFRIELGEIEAILGHHPQVVEAIVAARENGQGEKRLVAYVVPEQGQAATLSELRSFLKQKLPDYMVPSTFVFLDVLPLTPNGKVDRMALPEPDDSRPELIDGYVAPSTPIEKALAEMWMHVLDVEKVGIHDNFFDLGGHSLLAMQLISRVRNSFRMELPVRFLFESPTIAGLGVVVVNFLIEQTEPEETTQIFH